MEHPEIFMRILSFLDINSQINLISVSKKKYAYLPNLLIMMGKSLLDQQSLYKLIHNGEKVRLEKYYDMAEILIISSLHKLLVPLHKKIYFSKIKILIKHLYALSYNLKLIMNSDYDPILSLSAIIKMEEFCAKGYLFLEKYKPIMLKIKLEWDEMYERRACYYDWVFCLFKQIPTSVECLTIQLDHCVQIPQISSNFVKYIPSNVRTLKFKRISMKEIYSPIYARSFNSFRNCDHCHIERIFYPDDENVDEIDKFIPLSVKEIWINKNIIIDPELEGIIVKRY